MTGADRGPLHMEHRQIQSGHGAVHYWIQKNKDSGARCLVFTHGLTADHRMFDRQTSFFARDYTILTWDVPLHGLSRPYQAFSYRQTAVELRAILDGEGLKSVVLVGMSMGGYVSQIFAEQYPDRVDGLVALDTTPFGLAYYSKSDLWWLRQVSPIARRFPDRLLRRSMARSVSKTAYAYDKMMEMLAPLTKAQIVEQMGIAYGEFAAENRDMYLSSPVLILLGDSDRTGKVRQYCKAWAENTKYPLRMIQNAAHFSNGDNPEQVNAEIDLFVRGL